jgi:hypothetical protein
MLTEQCVLIVYANAVRNEAQTPNLAFSPLH